MDTIKRFLKYITIDTTSDSSIETNPTNHNQHTLARILIEELSELNISDITYDEQNCYVYATLKGNPSLPKIGFLAHMDTSKDAKGSNINPIFHHSYDGQDVPLNDKVTLSVSQYPDLKNHIGKTLITTDGTTLLGADDKAGIAEIMSLLEYFSTTKEEHGDIQVCFTPDEEVGLGTENINYQIFNPDIAYTVDGSKVGEFAYENFNAATATIKITGTPSHCGTAKGVMINAGRIATIINSLLPEEIPETTELYEGFFHLDSITGDVSSSTMKYLIRDFDITNFQKRKQILEDIISKLNQKYNNCIELTIKDTYRNMLEIINQYPSLIDQTKQAISETGITPFIKAIRGGTDGTRISFNGIPCPNLGTGGHNFHSVYEYICVEDIEKTTEILISIVRKFAKTKDQNLTLK